VAKSRLAIQQKYNMGRDNVFRIIGKESKKAKKKRSHEKPSGKNGSGKENEYTEV